MPTIPNIVLNSVISFDKRDKLCYNQHTRYCALDPAAILTAFHPGGLVALSGTPRTTTGNRVRRPVSSYEEETDDQAPVRGGRMALGMRGSARRSRVYGT